MGDLLRRREMVNNGIRYSLSGNSYLSWVRGQLVEVSGNRIHFYPNSLGWGQTLTANNLRYTWGQIKNGVLHFSCDYILTGLASNGDLAFSFGTYNTSNPDASSTRVAYFTPIDIKENGEKTIDIMIPLSSIAYSSGTPSDSNYFGLRIYAHTGGGSNVYIENVVFEIIL